MRIKALILVYLFVCFSVHSQKLRTDGVDVVVNGKQPSRIIGEKTKLVLEKKLIINTEDDETAKFGLYNISGFDIDAKGNIYFVSRGSEDCILKFGRKGNFVTSFCKRGQGPGELQVPGLIFLSSQNEIWINDISSHKWLVLTTEGILVKEMTRIDFDRIIPLQNRKYLVEKLQINAFGKIALQKKLLLLNSDFEIIKELDKLTFFNISDVIKFKASANEVFLGTTENNVFVGNEARGYEISVYDLEGNLKRVIKKAYKKVKMTEEYKARIEGIIYGHGVEAELKKKAYFSKYSPPYQYAFCSEEGYLFIMTFEKGENENEFIYDIFNPEGIYIDSISLNNYGHWTEKFKGPLTAKIRKDRLYLVRENKNDYRELVVYKMKWK